MHVFKLYLVVAPCLFLVLEATTLFASLLRQIGIVSVTLVLGWWLSRAIKGFFRSRCKQPQCRLAVIIASCDSEHGFLTASKLSRSGYYVLSGSQDMGGEMASGMERFNVDVIELQPTNENSMNDAYQEIAERLFKENRTLHALVCNVGTADLGEIEWISERGLLHAFDHTVVSTVRLVNRFLPMLREARGRVVVCAGPSGRVAIPGAGAYSLLNAALISFADCLRREMAKFRVEVVLVEPVWLSYRTPLSQVHSAGVVVKESVSCLTREVFDEYSLGYVNAFRNLWNHRTNRWYVGPPDEMARCTCLAVTDVPPRYVYACGHFEDRAVSTVLTYLPIQMVDLVQCFFYQASIPRHAHCDMPFARLPLWSESNQSPVSPSGRRRIPSPGFVQKYLHSALSPVAMEFPTSPMSTPTRELQAMKADYFPSADHTEDATPPPKSPPPVVRVTGECFKPHRTDGERQPRPANAKAWKPSSLPPVPPLGRKSNIAVVKQQPQQQAEPQQEPPVPDVSREVSTSSDPTASPDLSSSSTSQGPLSQATSPVPTFTQQTSSQPMSPQQLTSPQPSPPQPPPAGKCDAESAGGRGEESATQSEDGGSLVLTLMDDAECEVVASMFASAQRAVRERIQTPYPGNSVVQALPPQAEISALEFKSPPPAALPATQQRHFEPRGPGPWSPLSPYHTGIRPLPQDAMDLISPPDEGDTAAITPTGEHSRSPIDSATRVELVSGGGPIGAPGDGATHEVPLLPEASAPPPKHMSEPYAKYLERLRKSGQLEAEEVTDSIEEGSLPSRDPITDEGAKRRAFDGKSDQDDRH
ncbi:hypothetical protein HPB50_021815 [Hyalomma asiaticum]|uniref:Uncharacterized protein n=1 Tax=Hyalomma asiaticum TaxID=266040 RepID=A0ACB7RS50_HYAAI|nr:hypothetical protein HPB50_021815 [Hyalomma asiaticum]